MVQRYSFFLVRQKKRAEKNFSKLFFHTFVATNSKLYNINNGNNR